MTNSDNEGTEPRYKFWLACTQMFSLVAIPFVLLMLNSSIAKEKHDKEVSYQYVSMAISILKSCEKDESPIRNWAKRVLVEYSTVPFETSEVELISKWEPCMPNESWINEMNQQINKLKR